MNQTKKKLPFEAITHGYILVPKLLLETRLARQEKAMTELEALLTLLAKVNYKDAVCRINGQDIPCKRGESLYSMDTWAELFHWKRGKTRLFFQRLSKENIIELLPCLAGRTTHIKVTEYDLWTGCQYEAKQKKKEIEDERFCKFWDTFHSTTHTLKANRGRAEREWRKLKPEEQELAISGIDHYFFDTVRDTRYCKQAATYLSDKAYLNE